MSPDGNCLQAAVIYQAKVTRTDNNTHETYVGLTENDFKTRYRNHTAFLAMNCGNIAVCAFLPVTFIFYVILLSGFD